MDEESQLLECTEETNVASALGMVSTTGAMKACQTAKIKELGTALLAAGFGTIDEQAKALGLSRSTAWTILKANHKSSGLSAAVINRILAAAQLPPAVRRTVLDYVKAKAAGHYGGSIAQRRRFLVRLSAAARIEVLEMPHYAIRKDRRVRRGLRSRATGAR